jgi:hypothetical protein
MMRTFLLALLLPTLAALLLAQPLQEAGPRAAMQELAATIQAELEGHGERVLGREAYRWSTRLERITDCRAELSVRVTSNVGAVTIRNESVSFSLAAIEPYSIDLQKHWLGLPCDRGEKCIVSTSTCSTTTKEGMVMDCTNLSQKRTDSFAVQLDGDAGSAARLQQAFRKAVDLCREPSSVTF